MFERLLGLDFRRRRLLRDAAPGPLHNYLATPFPDGRVDFRSVEFVSLDLETTGLDPVHDEILSVGLVAFTAGRIALDTAARPPRVDDEPAFERMLDEAGIDMPFDTYDLNVKMEGGSGNQEDWTAPAAGPTPESTP